MLVRCGKKRVDERPKRQQSWHFWAGHGRESASRLRRICPSVSQSVYAAIAGQTATWTQRSRGCNRRTHRSGRLLRKRTGGADWRASPGGGLIASAPVPSPTLAQGHRSIQSTTIAACRPAKFKWASSAALHCRNMPSPSRTPLDCCYCASSRSDYSMRQGGRALEAHARLVPGSLVYSPLVDLHCGTSQLGALSCAC